MLSRGTSPFATLYTGVNIHEWANYMHVWHVGHMPSCCLSGHRQPCCHTQRHNMLSYTHGTFRGLTGATAVNRDLKFQGAISAFSWRAMSLSAMQSGHREGAPVQALPFQPPLSLGETVRCKGSNLYHFLAQKLKKQMSFPSVISLLLAGCQCPAWLWKSHSMACVNTGLWRVTSRDTSIHTNGLHSQHCTSLRMEKEF